MNKPNIYTVVSFQPFIFFQRHFGNILIFSFFLRTTCTFYPVLQPKKRNSFVWEHFTGEGIYATCKYCLKRVKYCGGTSNLQAHLKRCEPSLCPVQNNAKNEYDTQLMGPVHTSLQKLPKIEYETQDSYDSVEIVPEQHETILIPRQGKKTHLNLYI